MESFKGGEGCQDLRCMAGRLARDSPGVLPLLLAPLAPGPDSWPSAPTTTGAYRACSSSLLLRPQISVSLSCTRHLSITKSVQASPWLYWQLVAQRAHMPTCPLTVGLPLESGVTVVVPALLLVTVTEPPAGSRGRCCPTKMHTRMHRGTAVYAAPSRQAADSTRQVCGRTLQGE